MVDPADGDTDTFQNLFPTNHKFYGYADFFAWQNIHNPALQLKLTPSKTVSLQADYHRCGGPGQSSGISMRVSAGWPSKTMPKKS